MHFNGFTIFFRLLRWTMLALFAVGLFAAFGNGGRFGDPMRVMIWLSVSGAAFGSLIVAIVGELLSEIASDIRAMRTAGASMTTHPSDKNPEPPSGLEEMGRVNWHKV